MNSTNNQISNHLTRHKLNKMFKIRANKNLNLNKNGTLK